MYFLIGLLTLVMVLDCVVLIALVLISLPKKDTGGGLAFGGGATDALFGAGSGNAMTKITKYAAGIFFALAIILALLQRSYHNRTASAFEEQLQHPIRPAAGAVAPTPAPAPSTPASSPAMTPTGTNVPPAAGATDPTKAGEDTA